MTKGLPLVAKIKEKKREKRRRRKKRKRKKKERNRKRKRRRRENVRGRLTPRSTLSLNTDCELNL